VIGSHKAKGLLEDGRRLLEGGDPRAASLVLGRLLLLEPGHAEAQALMAAAQTAVAEGERRALELLLAAQADLDGGDREAARAHVQDAVRAGADRERVAALMDRLDQREGRIAPALAPDPVATIPPERPAGRAWSRAAFVALCAGVFTVMGVGVASTWTGLLARLSQAPSPRTRPVTSPPAFATTSAGDRAVAQARRLLESGNAQAALLALDAVAPQDPAYPFARQLRGQAERALGGRP
jgi:hypothetical protein